MSATPILTAAPVTTPTIIRALLENARSKGYRGGVLGVRAQPSWDGPSDFVQDDIPVRVVPCLSALAVREALLDRDSGRWLVVLTDRDDADLGAGVLSHLIGARLRTPDPWEAVRTRFAARTIDALLTSDPWHREIAMGLLAASPPSPRAWPPATGGVLTRDHALASTARLHLALAEPGVEIDTATVLRWTASPLAAARVADLRSLAGDALSDAVLGWMAGMLGIAAPVVGDLLAAGDVADVIPVGLVVGLAVPESGVAVSAEAAQAAREALIRLDEGRFGRRGPSLEALRIWAIEAARVAADLLLEPAMSGDADRVLARADTILHELRAEALAGQSDLLPSGLANRLGRLADVLREAVEPAEGRSSTQVDDPVVETAAAEPVERAWTAVDRHRLAQSDHRYKPLRGAVRLLRWLTFPAGPTGVDLPALVDRHRDADTWVDAAVNDVASGVGDPDLDAALTAVLTAVQPRRHAHDLSFASALAAYTRADAKGIMVVEDLLPSLILPLAKQAPTLLLIFDGMSSSVATEVVASVLERAADGWAEAVPSGTLHRGVALSVLPSLTDRSRTSLLCGELTTGGQEVERRGYERLSRAHGLPNTALFHKRPLDSSLPGQALAADVAAALDDVDRYPLVTCILNTIDDALDRSDPGGTDWTVDAVKHLRPLLERARVAGRTVVLTSDHGHVVERRQGTQRSVPAMSSARSRAVPPPPGDGEILVSGRRVLDAAGVAVLAVDETLRFGPLKSGYHGGASPAEVVVPLCFLVLGVPPTETLRLAGPQEPVWWWSPVPAVAPRATAAIEEITLPLFPPEAMFAPAETAGHALAAAVAATPTYASQRRLAGRTTIADDRVRSLMAALIDAEGNRLVPEAVGVALAEAPARLRGAVSQVQRLLNVEGYGVLHFDPDGVTLVLDVPLLREQFDLRT